MQTIDKYIFDFYDKTDTDLKIMLSRSASRILTSNLGVVEEMDEKERYQMAETILSYRKTKTAALDKLQKERDSVRESCYASLNGANTYCGQLIISILEEYGDFNISDLKTWNEELSGLDQRGYEDIINALVKEGGISNTAGNLHILRPCNEHLLFDDSDEFVKWGYNTLNKQSDTNEGRRLSLDRVSEIARERILENRKGREKIEKLMLRLVYRTCRDKLHAVFNIENFAGTIKRNNQIAEEVEQDYGHEWIEEQRKNGEYYAVFKWRDAVGYLETFKEAGIICEKTIDGIRVFYIPFYSEKALDGSEYVAQ